MVTSMLEKAIEIEGLLRIIRDGNPLPETYLLLNIKARQLAEQAETLNTKVEDNDEKMQSTPPQVDFVMASSEETDSQPHVDFTFPEQIPTGTLQEMPKGDAPTLSGERTEITEDDVDLTDEDDIILAFDEPSETSDTATDPEASAPQEQAEETAQKRQVKIKSSFSLNDRFLYSRELFDGNMKMFDSTLDFIEGVDDFAVIEDYFYNELELDPENSHVTTFMEILRPHFRG